MEARSIIAISKNENISENKVSTAKFSSFDLDTIFKIRFYLYIFSLINGIHLGLSLLTIDFSRDEDMGVQMYQHAKYKLITTWFSTISGFYMAVSIYCDWKKMKGDYETPIITKLNKARFIVFTSIIYPSTMFSDVLFWRIWNKDRELVVPLRVDKYVPAWKQHNLHTVSLAVTVLDLILIPRKRPKDLTSGIAVTMAFVTVYAAVVVHGRMNGVYIYPLIEKFDNFQCVLLTIYTYVEHLFHYISQWYIADFISELHGIRKISL